MRNDNNKEIAFAGATHKRAMSLCQYYRSTHLFIYSLEIYLFITPKMYQKCTQTIISDAFCINII